MKADDDAIKKEKETKEVATIEKKREAKKLATIEKEKEAKKLTAVAEEKNKQKVDKEEKQKRKEDATTTGGGTKERDSIVIERLRNLWLTQEYDDALINIYLTNIFDNPNIYQVQYNSNKKNKDETHTVDLIQIVLHDFKLLPGKSDKEVKYEPKYSKCKDIDSEEV